ncbi:class I SAM-dependent methyltransferase [Aminipila sp.]|uniref:class I SAM-dependent methyltransferase n=1 Tax=Aminipila sp. TaxID=2060095 RepID=UPI0028A0D966|nr:methyltransferase domain-containing protein [Aminipila sp.]
MDLSEVTYNKKRHPWELSRCDCLTKLFKEDVTGKTVLDIGCGDFYFDDMLIDCIEGTLELTGIDTYLDEERHLDKGHWYNQYSKIEGKKFDRIIMLDVLEHIEEDEKFMDEIKQYAEENAKFLITVPAFQKLFSAHDVELKHYRRYNYKQLSHMLSKCDLKINKYFYFYVCLVPLRLISKKSIKKAGNWRYSENALITKFIRATLNFDFTICKMLSKLNINLGGLSLFVEAEYVKETSDYKKI